MRLRLFGSVARREAGNDVDLVAEFDRAWSLIDLVGLENRLSDLLGRPVDVAQERRLKPRVQANVDREAVVAFEDPVEPLSDILEHIGDIERFLRGMGPVDLQNDAHHLRLSVRSAGHQ